MIEDLLLKAEQMGASDLHLTCGYKAAARVNGKIVFIGDLILTASLLKELTEALLSQGQLQRFLTQGEIDFAYSCKNIRCRINIFRQSGSPAIAVRIIKAAIPALQELGLPNAVKSLIDLRQGLVLITGPTGSGKTTTLAALVQHINETASVNILTLEDPVEYKYGAGMSIINQREIGVDTESFASGLKSALREDPDVILVGELRDRETMATALTAAETGHLVLSTLHTREAVSAVSRILDVFKENQQQICSQLADSLQAVVAQELRYSKKLQRRIAVFEVLIVTPAVRNLIREGKLHQLGSYIQTGAQYGMVTKADYLQQLEKQGKI